MSDFFQNGVLSTLQKLKDRLVEDIEEELKGSSRWQKICPILPALDSEFEGPAMPAVVEDPKAAYRDDPIGAPLRSAWVRVRAAIPDFAERLRVAVDRENVQ